MMSRHNYCAIAEIISQYRGKSPEASKIVAGLANYFMKNNPRFDTDRFLEACGAEEHKGG